MRALLFLGAFHQVARSSPASVSPVIFLTPFSHGRTFPRDSQEKIATPCTCQLYGLSKPCLLGPGKACTSKLVCRCSPYPRVPTWSSMMAATPISSSVCSPQLSEADSRSESNFKAVHQKFSSNRETVFFSAEVVQEHLRSRRTRSRPATPVDVL